ncbi:MAG: hypothetical protein QOE05_3776 [Actinomycetota bacterium]|jgi:hypothetical protein|nr:hypothetical protein [Actinomycetota bacterium]
MSVTDVDAERVYRCAFRLEQVAADVRTAAARTAHCYPDDWRGEAGIAYQLRLDETADRVRRMSVAYDAASAALMPYARALLDAQDTWRRAESLLAEADAAELEGADPGLRSAAYRLQAEAAEMEHRAAVVCAATLDDEAGRAPATSAWRSADRFLGDVARFGVDTVAGTASLAGMAWHALPGVGDRHSRHDARRDLVEAGKAAVSVWNIPVEIRDALEDGRPGVAAAAVAGAFGPGKLSKLDRQLRRNPSLAEKEAYREADRRALKVGHAAYRQTALEMGRDGVSLVNEELRGGHVLERHVGASRSFLRLRNATEAKKAGTFRDLETAERLVNAVLAAHADELGAVYALQPGKTLPITARFDFSTGRVTLRGSSKSFATHAVTVVLKLDEGGEPFVYTAFPEL